MHLLRCPPGDPSSLELCIDAALGPVEDFAETATMVADKINALNPNMSELGTIYFSKTKLTIHSLCRRLDTFAHHRSSFDEKKIYTYNPLFTRDKCLARRI
jgi:hypothetical protein